jgi:cell division protein FtsW (lipid II flippase)
MSLRDPRVSKAVQIAFVVMLALWLVNFGLEETHSTLSWVLLPLNIAVLVGFLFLLLRDFGRPSV